jgi:THO complex subunit 2
MIPKAASAKSSLQKMRTALFYSQRKYNLLREENEGYSKLIVDLEQSARPAPLARRAQRAYSTALV